MKLLKLSLFVASFLSLYQSQPNLLANDDIFMNPKREISAVHPDSKAESVVRLSNAKVVLANYDLIRRDFGLKGMDERQIDQWLLKNAAIMAKTQADQTLVNGPIPHEDEKIEEKTAKAFRPPEYGRSLVVQVDHQESGHRLGLIDIKGAGALNPENKDHSNGLATLAECIREFNYEGAIRRVLKHAELDRTTVGSYAVIDPGFDVKWTTVDSDGHEHVDYERAGLYLRQAHNRILQEESKDYTGNGWIATENRLRYAQLFNMYGIYLDKAENIQGTQDEDIFDFGHFVVVDDGEFKNHRGDNIKLERRNEDMALPFSHFGINKETSFPKEEEKRPWFYSITDRPAQFARDTVKSYLEKGQDSEIIKNHHREMMVAVDGKLKTAPKPEKTLVMSLVKESVYYRKDGFKEFSRSDFRGKNLGTHPSKIYNGRRFKVNGMDEKRGNTRDEIFKELGNKSRNEIKPLLDSKCHYRSERSFLELGKINQFFKNILQLKYSTPSERSNKVTLIHNPTVEKKKIYYLSDLDKICQSYGYDIHVAEQTETKSDWFFWKSDLVYVNDNGVKSSTANTKKFVRGKNFKALWISQIGCTNRDESEKLDLMPRFKDKENKEMIKKVIAKNLEAKIKKGDKSQAKKMFKRSQKRYKEDFFSVL